MRFSIYYALQLPQPWEAGGEQRLIQEALEQIALADRLGFDTAWAAEHHFLEEHSHSSAPGVLLAAASQRTDTIRLGLANLPLPPGYQHPARVAETAATLDLVSGGRVELGTDETSSGAELAGFGVDRKTKRAQADEALSIVARMMVETPFAGADTDHIKIAPRNVIPKPVQQPHPPLWAACSRREATRHAGERGLGALSFVFVDPEEVQPWVEEYYTTITSDRCVPAGFAINPNFAVALPMMVHDDEAEAIERGIDGAHFLGYALGHYSAFGEHQPGRTSVWDEFLARRDDVGYARSAITADGGALGVKVLQHGLGSLRGAIGTPAQVRELIGRFEDAGVDELAFCLQTGKIKHNDIMEALELFAAEVMPEFAQRRPERARAKAQRRGDAAERALARRAPRRTVARGYAFGPNDSGADPEATAAPAPEPEAAAPSLSAARRAPGAAVTSLRERLEARGERAFQAFVGRSDDARLERTAGSGAGLKVIFGAMERQFVPERAAGFSGEIQYNLRAADGAIRSWTVTVDGERARARPGAAAGEGGAKLTITLALADFIRIAARDLDPVAAVLTGKMELAGDFAVALKLGEMFGQPPAF
jgi:alkanesulfonate monooxygenase SsuD/methylene tetrahydromethanopterin reductase-like flavin-dependent oxidoreductase (luciferase family)/putative sterol carrier protein